MIGAEWGKIVAQWRDNRRLRLAVLVVLAILGWQVLDMVDRQRQAEATEYGNSQELRRRLERIADQPEWEERARQAEAELETLRRQLMAVSGSGQAQAEVRSWLTEFAGAIGLPQPMIKVEDVLDVPEHPELLQVLARMEGRLPTFGHAPLARGISRGLPWIQVERLEIGEDGRVSMVVRAYYRRSAQALAGDQAEEGQE